MQRIGQNHNNKLYDLLVIGGGIVGCATAREVARRHPRIRIAIIEKEPALGNYLFLFVAIRETRSMHHSLPSLPLHLPSASHQSGRNSGVVHAGIYYTPGTLKAQLCVQGSHRLYEYCAEKGIPVKRVGKLILAADEDEVPLLNDLLQRGTGNGVRDLQLVDERQAKEIQPGVSCRAGLWSPSTGITDYALIANSFASDSAADVLTHFHVAGIAYDQTRKVITANSKSGHQVESRYLITAGGLFADKLSVMSGSKTMPAIVPFRGEYLLMKPMTGKAVIRTNIYPVPDPRFPFLGVHFTPRLDGSVLIGPNAVFAFKREGYSFWDFSLRETCESLAHTGFQKLAAKYFVRGLDEMRRSVSLKAQMRQIQRLLPQISIRDVEPGPSGVRAQAVDNDGKLIEDFIFDTGTEEFASRVLHVRNAPSPAATSSLAIASVVADKFDQFFQQSER